ncbi:AMP-binding protein [Pseudonocardia sp. WMMC193]|uniref:AMP-binding protein n=1 Tax=Pseudonocardia sp. WMMC193 TaxID=2911965 RepID=UPI001F2C5D5A|nr:AMP-binding protein [Pseudonocardia sp. WMMC193]MCF7548202.1 AMP-binding protein [Pseudonocardia sp. WMMC193]
MTTDTDVTPDPGAAPPAAAPEPACPLAEIVDGMADRTGSRLFFHGPSGPEEATFARCRADAGVLAEALRGAGVGPGSRVAVHGATGIEWVLADLACTIAGALSVALYSTAPVPRAVAAAVESRCVLALTDRAEAVPAFQEAGLTVLFLGPVGSGDGAGVASVGDLVAAGADEGFRPAHRRTGPFTVVSTSGTLSEPKLFAVHADPLLFTMDRFAEIYGIDGRDRLLLYLPLSHLPQRMMLYWGLRTGLDFVLSDPARFVADTARYDPTLHVTVPRVLEHLHGRAAAAGAPAPAAAVAAMLGSSVRSVFVGSAPTPPALMAELLDAGIPLYEVYGTTELGMIGLNTPEARKPGTVGRPIPWGRVRLDVTTREILVRTPTPFLYGRLVDGRVERRSWDPQRYEPTADAGSFDAQGHLTVLGRTRDFVALGSGEKVFVRPIEEAVAAATGAGLCQVGLRPDGRLGALLFFEHPDPARPPLGEVLTTVNGAVPGWERIRSYAVVDRMPTVEEGCLTETTKPRRHAIDEIHGRGATWVAVR